MRSHCKSAYRALVLLLALLPALAVAAPAGEVTHVSGVCMVRKADGTSKVLAPKTLVEQGDVVVTAHNAYALFVRPLTTSSIPTSPEPQAMVAKKLYTDRPSSDGR